MWRHRHSIMLALVDVELLLKRMSEIGLKWAATLKRAKGCMIQTGGMLHGMHRRLPRAMTVQLSQRLAS